MNIFDETGLPASYGNEALVRQQGRLRDREADLKEEMKAARAKGAPQGQMVSGIYVAPSKLQQLGPIAAQIAGEVKQRGLQADQTGYDAREAQAAKQHMAMQPAEDAPPTEKLAWAQRGAQIPAIRSMMSDYATDLMVRAPERQEARAERKDSRAQTIAAAQSKQQEELAYRRTHDAQQDQLRRDIANGSNDLRMTIAQLVKGNGSGRGGATAPAAIGDDGEQAWKTVKNPKANEIIAKENCDGTTTLVYKPTGEKKNIGLIGRESAGITKERQEQGEKVSNAKKALEDLKEAELILPQATGSATGSLRDTIMGAAGMSTDGAKAAAKLDQIASTLASQVPRLGGSSSDADLVFYKQQVGNLGDRSKPVETRMAALKQVRKFMERASDPASYSSPTGRPEAPKPPAGPSIREAVQSSTDDALLNKYLRK